MLVVNLRRKLLPARRWQRLGSMPIFCENRHVFRCSVGRLVYIPFFRLTSQAWWYSSLYQGDAFRFQSLWPLRMRVGSTLSPLCERCVISICGVSCP